MSLSKAHAHLTTKVLNLDRVASESHHEAALELIFGSAELFWRYGAIQQKCELVYEDGRTTDLVDGANEANKPNSDESLYIWWKDEQ
jgi:hypothetical protein